jgi:hypothetical protein
MKSFLFIFILSLLNISNILSNEEGCGKVTSYNKENCNNAINSDDKKNYEKCCYLKFRQTGADKDSEGCTLLTKYQFEHVKDVIRQNQYTYSGTYVIECKANYIKFSLLSLALLFI